MHPLGLVAKAGVWYLIATPEGEAEPALFRVSRVRACATRPEPAARPAGFDLEAAWARLRQRVEVRQRDLEVTVTVAPATAPMVRRLLPSHTRSADGDTLRLAFNGVDHAVGSLLGLATRSRSSPPPAYARRCAPQQPRSSRSIREPRPSPSPHGGPSRTPGGPS